MSNLGWGHQWNFSLNKNKKLFEEKTLKVFTQGKKIRELLVYKIDNINGIRDRLLHKSSHNLTGVERY